MRTVSLRLSLWPSGGVSVTATVRLRLRLASARRAAGVSLTAKLRIPAPPAVVLQRPTRAWLRRTTTASFERACSTFTEPRTREPFWRRASLTVSVFGWFWVWAIGPAVGVGFGAGVPVAPG